MLCFGVLRVTECCGGFGHGILVVRLVFWGVCFGPSLRLQGRWGGHGMGMASVTFVFHNQTGGLTDSVQHDFSGSKSTLTSSCGTNVF